MNGQNRSMHEYKERKPRKGEGEDFKLVRDFYYLVKILPISMSNGRCTPINLLVIFLFIFTVL